MFKRISNAIFKRTGIAADKQHTMHTALVNIDIIDDTGTTQVDRNIDLTEPDKLVFSGRQFVISVQNDRVDGEGGKLERAYGFFYESKPYNDGVTLLDIIECFERFIDKNDMQGYGNVITTLRVIHSPVLADCKEICIEFE